MLNHLTNVCCYCVGIVAWNHIILCKLFVFDRNTWNHIIVSKWFVLQRNIWNHIIVCKLFIFDRNTWNHIIMSKLFVLKHASYLPWCSREKRIFCLDWKRRDSHTCLCDRGTRTNKKGVSPYTECCSLNSLYLTICITKEYLKPYNCL